MEKIVRGKLSKKAIETMLIFERITVMLTLFELVKEEDDYSNENLMNTFNALIYVH